MSKWLVAALVVGTTLALAVPTAGQETPPTAGSGGVDAPGPGFDLPDAGEDFDRVWEKMDALLEGVRRAEWLSVGIGGLGLLLGVLLLYYLAGLSPAGGWWQWALALVLALGFQQVGLNVMMDRAIGKTEADWTTEHAGFSGIRVETWLLAKHPWLSSQHIVATRKRMRDLGKGGEVMARIDEYNIFADAFIKNTLHAWQTMRFGGLVLGGALMTLLGLSFATRREIRS